MKRNAAYASFKSDSLERELIATQQYISNIQRILNGDPPIDTVVSNEGAEIDAENVSVERSEADSIFREEIEQEEKYAINSQLKRENKSSFFFFKPIEGIISSEFDRNARHYGIDLVAKENESIKAVLEGTVILAEWTTDNGHIIQIQHRNNWVSVYKHCSVLFKKAGEQVKAGEAIAIVGNSGTETTGPHLHFELWENGSPKDPQQYIAF
jgi:lipoprotein NlpD